MDNDIFEVSRDEYKGFVAQIKPECRETKIETKDSEVKEISIFSTKTKKKLCSRQLDSEGFETYYVFEMPDDDERRAAKPVQKFTLNTKEEVQAFINIMNKFLNKQ